MRRLQTRLTLQGINSSLDPSTTTLQIEIDPSDPDGMYHYHHEETSLSVVRCNDLPLRMFTTSQGALFCYGEATAAYTYTLQQS